MEHEYFISPSETIYCLQLGRVSLGRKTFGVELVLRSVNELRRTHRNLVRGYGSATQG
jgi:hypothetical protein